MQIKFKLFLKCNIIENKIEIENRKKKSSLNQTNK